MAEVLGEHIDMGLKGCKDLVKREPMRKEIDFPCTIWFLDLHTGHTTWWGDGTSRNDVSMPIV